MKAKKCWILTRTLLRYYEADVKEIVAVYLSKEECEKALMLTKDKWNISHDMEEAELK